MRIFFTIVLITISGYLFAQKTDKRKGSYSAYLYDVEKPIKIKEFALDSITQSYEDSNIKIVWQYAGSQIGFELTNKLDKTIKVLWDEAAFISVSNETEKIFHKGIKYIDRENSQSPTAIYKGTTLSDLFSPTSYTSYTSGQYGGWNSRPLIPAVTSRWNGKAAFDESLVGRTLKVVLPIKVDEETLEYMFSFRTTFQEKK